MIDTLQIHSLQKDYSQEGSYISGADEDRSYYSQDDQGSYISGADEDGGSYYEGEDGGRCHKV